MAAQYLTISRLSNIISMITLGQQSGILRVIRGQGAGREVGQIKFVNGNPTSALLGQLTGANALSVLSNWGECVYSFEDIPSDDAPFEPHDAFGSDPGYPSYGLNSGPLPNVPWPTYSFPSSAPVPPPASPAQMPTTNPLNGGSQPGYWPAQSSGSGANWGSAPGYGQPGQPASGQFGSYGSPSGAGWGATDPLGTYAPRNPPQRTLLSEQIDQLPLDRRERMVLLLVDGQRNLSDLARLTRRSERELLNVLEYLAGLGLVRL
jgi:hypothetical protein